MASRKKSVQPPPNLPEQSESQMSLFPFTKQQELEKRENWVAEAGSELEKELLARWAKQPGLADDDRALINEWIDGGFQRIAGSDEVREFLKRWINQKPLTDWECNKIREWIDKPDSRKKRDELFQLAAKRSVVGHAVYETAKERQARLSSRAWIVAWAIAQGLTRRQILTLIGREGVRTVANSIQEIKGHIDPDKNSFNYAQITRWFFGH
jgi:hypothetical protein